MRSNTSQGFTGGSLFSTWAWFNRSTMFFRMYRVERPRTPPPSRDNRHKPVVSTGFGSPPCLVAVACSMVVAECRGSARSLTALCCTSSKRLPSTESKAIVRSELVLSAGQPAEGFWPAEAATADSQCTIHPCLQPRKGAFLVALLVVEQSLFFSSSQGRLVRSPLLLRR